MDCTLVLHVVRVGLGHAVDRASPQGWVRHFHHAARTAVRPAASACRQAALLAKPLAVAAAIGLIVGPAVPALLAPGHDQPTVISSQPTFSIGLSNALGSGTSPMLPTMPLPTGDVDLVSGFGDASIARWQAPITGPMQFAPFPSQQFAEFSDLSPEMLPEPGTIVLLATGLVGLALTRLARWGHAGVARPTAAPPTFAHPTFAHRAIARKSSATRLAPPTSAPPTSGTASRDAALPGLTDPP